MFWFLIPAIIGATSTGLGIASQVTDGAVWYPEINTYKQELVREQNTNGVLNSQINNLITMDNDLRKNYENLDNTLGALAAKITEIENQAADQIYDKQIQNLSPDYLATLRPDMRQQIVSGILMTGSYTIIKAPSVVVNGVIVQPARSAARSIKGARIVASLGKMQRVNGAVQAFKGSRIAAAGGQVLKGIGTGGRVFSKVLGPLSAFLDIGLLGLDIHLAAQKRDQYAEAVKSARNINFELNNDIQNGKNAIRANQEAYHQLAAETKDLLFYLQNIIQPIREIDRHHKEMRFSTETLIESAQEFIRMLDEHAANVRKHRIAFIENSLFDIKDSFVTGLDLDTVARLFPEFSREFLDFVRQTPIAGFDFSLQLQCQNAGIPVGASQLDIEYWDGDFLMGSSRMTDACADKATATNVFHTHTASLSRVVLKNSLGQSLNFSGINLIGQGRMKLQPSQLNSITAPMCVGPECSPCTVYDLTENQIRSCDDSELGLHGNGLSADFYESFLCVARYVEARQCDWEHWSAMYDECQTYRHKGLSDEFLIPKVRAGECRPENWDRLSAQIGYQEKPPVTFLETMQCIEAYKRSNQCDGAHWNEIASTCHVSENSAFPMAGDVLVNEGGHRKVIKANGAFIVSEKTLGHGRWVSPTRFVVFVKEWGDLWWAGELNAEGLMTDVAASEEEAISKPLTYQENWTTYFIYDRKANVLFSDGNKKEIRLNGDFIVNGRKLGHGHWLSPTRFVVFIQSWGNRWWIGDVGPGGVKSTTVLETREIASAVPGAFEPYSAEFNSDFSCNQLGL